MISEVRSHANRIIAVSKDSAKESDLYTRPRVDEPRVQSLIARLAASVSADVVDLGGTMSLNVQLVNRGVVMRVHPRFVTRARLAALQNIRAAVARAGLVVAEPVEVDGSVVIEVGGRLAEVEPFITHAKPPATWESYVWMYQSMGRLHRALAPYTEPVPEPVVATYGDPPSLRTEAAITAVAVRHDAVASQIARRVSGLIDDLEHKWIPEGALPSQVIHGDIRLGNVAKTATDESVFFDFGFAARRPRIHDLAYSLSWMVLRPDGSGLAEEFRWDRLPEILSAYEDAAQDQLQPVERQALASYIAAVPLYLAAVGSHTPDPAAQLRGEVPFIRIAAWILSNAGEVTRHAEAD